MAKAIGYFTKPDVVATIVMGLISLLLGGVMLINIPWLSNILIGFAPGILLMNFIVVFLEGLRSRIIPYK